MMSTQNLDFLTPLPPFVTPCHLLLYTPSGVTSHFLSLIDTQLIVLSIQTKRLYVQLRDVLFPSMMEISLHLTAQSKDTFLVVCLTVDPGWVRAWQFFSFNFRLIRGHPLRLVWFHASSTCFGLTCFLLPPSSPMRAVQVLSHHKLTFILLFLN